MQVCTLLQTDNHASTPPHSFLQAGCPSCHPTNSVKALKAKNDKARRNNKRKKTQMARARDKDGGLQNTKPSFELEP